MSQLFLPAVVSTTSINSRKPACTLIQRTWSLRYSSISSSSHRLLHGRKQQQQMYHLHQQRYLNRCNFHTSPFRLMTTSTVEGASVSPPASSSPSSSSSSIRVLSRRFLEQRDSPHKKTPVSKDKSKKKKTDETPWPRPVRIIFYAAVVMGIPYSIAELIASSPYVRSILEGDKPHDPTDSAFGKALVQFVRNDGGWGIPERTSYTDCVKQLKNKSNERRKALVASGDIDDDSDAESTAKRQEEEEALLLKFENEQSTHDRMVEREIEYLRHGKVKVHVTLLSSSSSSSSSSSGDKQQQQDGISNFVNVDDDDEIIVAQADGIVDGMLPVSNDKWDKIKAVLQAVGVQWHDEGRRAVMALDFYDDDHDDNDQDPDDEGNMKKKTEKKNEDNIQETKGTESTPEMEEFITFDSDGTTTGRNDIEKKTSSLRMAADEIRKLTHTYSAWNYFPQQDNANTATTTASSSSRTKSSSSSSSSIVSNRLSDEQVQMSELEYRIKELKFNLGDVNCTRDIDTMQKELSEAQGELRRLKWKRRLRKLVSFGGNNSGGGGGGGGK